ncbi:unnamed protein product [Protopolystoma xenopodis]|uniref:Uncharacterized protein n=1 Tax=Protopolystoma xenopodis TaxID=117903 RepID=A0A448WW43_9PLAT|nr:unnamed protein product [Protopolystoma xenopodis]
MPQAWKVREEGSPCLECPKQTTPRSLKTQEAYSTLDWYCSQLDGRISFGNPQVGFHLTCHTTEQTNLSGLGYFVFLQSLNLKWY